MGSLTAGTIMEILGEGLGAQRARARTLGRLWIWIRVWVPAVFAVLSFGPRSCLGICFLMAQSVPREPVCKLFSLQRSLAVTVRQDGFCAVLPGRGPALPLGS